MTHLYLGCKNIFLGIISSVSTIILIAKKKKEKEEKPAASSKPMPRQFAVVVAQQTWK